MRRSFWLLVLFVVGIAFGVLYHRGMTMRYAAPELLERLEPLRQQEDQVFEGGSISGGSQGSQNFAFDAVRSCQGTLQRQPDEDLRQALLRHVRRVAGTAQGLELGVVPGGFVCEEFGEELAEPLAKLPLSHTISTDSGSSSSTGALAGRKRMVLAQLHLASRQNIAVQVVWTFVVDLQTGQCLLQTRTFGLGDGHQEFDVSNLGDLTIK